MFVPTVATVRAFSSAHYPSDKAILDGVIRAGFENPKESSHGGLRFTLLRSLFAVRRLGF
jgi:hypothetical protein